MRKRVGYIWWKGRVGHRLYITKGEIREEMGYLEIRDRIESDHHSLIAWMRKGERTRNGGGRLRRVGI